MKTVSIIGIGMDGNQTLTVEARHQLEKAALLIGATRMLQSVREVATNAKEQLDTYLPEEMEKKIVETGYEDIVILMSGDTGFFSGTKKIADRLASVDQVQVCIYPGISSLSYLAAKAGVSWEDATILSLHGKEAPLLPKLRLGEKVFAITGANVKDILISLQEHGYGKTAMVLGENLGSKKEQILAGTVDEILETKQSFEMCVLLFLPEKEKRNRLFGLRDEEFITGKAPITKSEVRAISLSRLSIKPEDVVYDIGAGTGSVSIEMAFQAYRGKVYAIEEKQDALDLIQENKEKFGCSNIEVIAGRAPECMQDLPKPDVVFVGGTSGNMEEILRLVLEKNPTVQLVINVISLESIAEVTQMSQKLPLEDLEIVEIQSARDKAIGRYHLMQGQNPVYVISAKGCVPKSKEEKQETVQVPRICIAGTGSGAGKTTFTCGLLRALQNRGYQPRSFKCGPDYIDPMFHSKTLGVVSGNLDSFFMDKKQMLHALTDMADANEKTVTVIEGVMGYYDGIGLTREASTYDVAKKTQTPVVLLVPCRGMSASILSMIRGYVEKGSMIAGVILNQVPEMYYEDLKAEIEKLGISCFGYLRNLKDATIESRHLGLVTPNEIEDFQSKIELTASQIEETVDVDELLRVMQQAKPLEPISKKLGTEEKNPVTIAVAKDEAFCFYYKENIEILEKHDARVIYFSPLHDRKLPNCNAVILPGGYPELYARMLSENTSMKESIKEAIEQGLPCIAECGGFLYLHSSLATKEGDTYPMCDVIHEKAYYQGRNKRFGYVEIETTQESCLGKAGQKLRGHEFHYFESDRPGVALCCVKPGQSDRKWQAGYLTKTMYAGFPHIHFGSNPDVVQAFLEKACVYQKGQKE